MQGSAKLMEAHKFHPSALREYDIRGIVDDTLTETDAYALGRAYAVMLREAGGGGDVAIGFDGRESSPELAEALAAGLVSSGLHVFRVGLCSTPTLYFAVHELGVNGGIMVTGSHNPSEYNGFKLLIGKCAIYGRDIQRLGEIAAGGHFVNGRGRCEDVDIVERHIDRIVADNPVARAMKVVWDPGHGASAAILPALAARLPGEHILINCEVDSGFPAHHPDPTLPENLADLQNEVRARRADFGVAFDGDGDRIGVVDGDGEIVWADQLLVLLAVDLLKRRPGATIVADVKASQVLFDAIVEAGGVPLMWRTGHSLIKAKIAETGALLAGEMSGHIFFNDGYYGFDDALYAAVRSLSILSNMSQSLSDFRKALPKVYNTPEIRIACSEERKFAVVRGVARRLEATRSEVAAVDGVRVQLGDGWWLLRASNTEDALVARCEAQSEVGLQLQLQALTTQLRRSGIEARLV